MFVGAGLGFIFANAWNALAMAMFSKYEKKDPVTGKTIYPLWQMFMYAMGVSLLCALLVWYMYTHTGTKMR